MPLVNYRNKRQGVRRTLVVHVTCSTDAISTKKCYQVACCTIARITDKQRWISRSILSSIRHIIFSKQYWLLFQTKYSFAKNWICQNDEKKSCNNFQERLQNHPLLLESSRTIIARVESNWQLIKRKTSYSLNTINEPTKERYGVQSTW